MVRLMVQISVWIMVSCGLPKQHLIFPWFTLNKSWFSKYCSIHLHPLSSSPNINFILCLHRKENTNFPCGVIWKKAKIFTLYKWNMDLITCYKYIFYIRAILPQPKLVLWLSKPASVLLTQFAFNHPGWASFTEPLRNSSVAKNSADWDRSYSFCSNGKFISVAGVSCHQSVPGTHININGSFVCIVQVGNNHHYLLNTNGVPGPDH